MFRERNEKLEQELHAATAEMQALRTALTERGVDPAEAVSAEGLKVVGMKETPISRYAGPRLPCTPTAFVSPPLLIPASSSYNLSFAFPQSHCLSAGRGKGTP